MVQIKPELVYVMAEQATCLRGFVYGITTSSVSFYHIEAETKWTPFRRRQFQVHFVERKCLNSDKISTEVCS